MAGQDSYKVRTMVRFHAGPPRVGYIGRCGVGAARPYFCYTMFMETTENQTEARQEVNTISKKPRTYYLVMIGVGAVCAVICGMGGFILGKQSFKSGVISESTINQQLSPTPSINDNNNLWTNYEIVTEPSLGFADYSVSVPSGWKRIEHSSNFQDTETIQDDYANFTYKLIIHQEKNYNDKTKKPYANLREATGFPYDVETLTVDGQPAAQVLPRAGSESKFMVLLFSKDHKLVSIGLDTPDDGSKIEEGKLLFGKILATFKFKNQTGNVTPSATSPVSRYPKPASWKTVNIAKLNVSVCLPLKWEANEQGNIVFNRDPAYKPDVATIVKYDYLGGSRRDEYINIKVKYEYEPEKLKNATKVSEVNINGLAVLSVAIPTFPEALVFVKNNQLYEVAMSSWNLVNDSKSAFLKDIYTMVGCITE
jgi:hypothetical protein